MKYYKIITNLGELYTRVKPSMSDAQEYKELMLKRGYKTSELIFQYIEIKLEPEPIKFIKSLIKS